MSNVIPVPPHLKSVQKRWRASNPVFLIRQQLGLSRPLFALWLGTDVNTVRLVEQGWFSRLPARLIRALEDAGFDGQEVAVKYVSWRAGFRAAVQQAMDQMASDAGHDEAGSFPPVPFPKRLEAMTGSDRLRLVKGGRNT